MAQAVGYEVAGNSLSLPSSQKPRRHRPLKHKETERLARSWRDLEERLARLPLDKTGRTLQGEDEVLVSEQLLATEDVPFDYDLTDFYDVNEFPHWSTRSQRIQASLESTRKLFSRWAAAAPASDIGYRSKVPAMLRYALKRPLMPEKELDRMLKELGFKTSSSRSMEVLASSKVPGGKVQRPLHVMYPDIQRSHHPSVHHCQLISNDWIPASRQNESPKRCTADDTEPGVGQDEYQGTEEEEALHRRLQDTYDSFKEGALVVAEAIDRYRALLGVPDISIFDLAWRLEAIGIPRQHLLSYENEVDDASLKKLLTRTCALLNEGQLGFESAIIRYRFLLDMADATLPDLAARLEDFGLPRSSIFGEVRKEGSSSQDSPPTLETEITEDIEHLIEAYRSGNLNLSEAVSFVSMRLDGMVIDRPYFSLMLSSDEVKPAQAAQAIFEYAAEESPPSSPNHGASADVIQDLEKIANHFFQQYSERILDGLDPGMALTEYREEYDLDDFSLDEVSFILAEVQGRRKSLHISNDTKMTSGNGQIIQERSRVLGSDMLPPEIRVSRDRSASPESETLAWSYTSGDKSITTYCSEMNFETTESRVAESEQSSSGKARNTEAADYDVLSSPPEEGFSADLWGLKMPTQKARRLGLDIGLPKDYVDRRIRSDTPQRTTSRRLRKSSFSVYKSPAKRKASATVHHRRRMRPPTLVGGVDLYAEEWDTRHKFAKRTTDAGSSMDCASADFVLNSESSFFETNNSKYDFGHPSAQDLDGRTAINRSVETVKAEDDIHEFMSPQSDSSPNIPGKSDTILEVLESKVIEAGIFRIDHPQSHERYNNFIQDVALGLKACLAAGISSSSIRPIQNPTERQLVVMLGLLERDPSSATVSDLVTLIQHGLSELAKKENLGSRANYSRIEDRDSTSLSPGPRASIANSGSEVEFPPVLDGALNSTPCSHGPSSMKVDLYELYFGKSDLLRDTRCVARLFSCPECSKPIIEPMGVDKPMKRPQRLRLTQPKKPRIPNFYIDGTPFLGIPRDMSYSAAEEHQSFFVGLQTRRGQRPKADHLALKHRYFQNPTASPSSSGSTSNLNKLFDKYKGIAPVVESSFTG